MHLNRTTRLAPLARIIYVHRLSIKQLAVVKLWVEPGVRSFQGSGDAFDAQKLSQFRVPESKISSVSVTVVDECMCPAQCEIANV